MGKITDTVVAIFLLIIMIVVLAHLGITWHVIYSDFKSFISSSPSGNVTSP